ncbi:jg7580 [Pararge aegeria aegeria]|uniref:Jg7580 protein n=1 Tax=Pararge aegeria aegeria TaxID=348720 RepID=A0A8S4SD91_9NEOP|nr:jg7580 [Pararge aegeria aegeria]
MRRIIFKHAGQERVMGLHTPLRTLWRSRRHAGFLTMFYFTVEASDLLLPSLGLSPYLVGRNLPLYVVPLVRLPAGFTLASRAHSRSLARRPGRQVLKQVIF